MISEELRRPYVQQYRRKLREHARQPGLTPDERKRVARMLAGLDKPKQYRPDEPPQPGAIDPGPMPPAGIDLGSGFLTFESLSKHVHSRLYLYAVQEGLNVTPGDTKAKIIQTILNQEQGKNR